MAVTPVRPVWIMVPDVLKVESGPLLNGEDTKGLSDRNWAKMGRQKEKSHRKVERIIKVEEKEEEEELSGIRSISFLPRFQIQPARPFL